MPAQVTAPERLRRLAHRILGASPSARNLGLATLSRLVRLAARLRMGPGADGAGRPDPVEVLARTDELNRAAERYYSGYPDTEFILGKPYSEEEHFARRLYDLGVLFHAVRLSRHDVVLELGAGTCWVSHFLNLHGCKTISVDVSETALSLGRKLFERDSRTRWDAAPEFVLYDGHRIPLPDASCDKIVINDAFHHFPNPEEVLRELARLLPEGGILAMSEPGPGHSQTEESRREVEATGVLENEIVLEELDAAARRAGFTEVNLLPVRLSAVREVPVRDLGRAAESRALLDQWLHLHKGPYYLVLHKGPWVPTTRRPDRLAAGIELLAPRSPLRAAPGRPLAVRVRVANRGDTRWLATAVERPGWTRLGAHLYLAAGEGPGELVDPDWLRASLPGDLGPGEAASFEVELPPLREPGDYLLVFDLVAEQVTWFAQRGSRTLQVPLRVTATG
ncbi:MAG TPA: class I SAM-dependent methyltransferase [Thermoanaerobaculia bacterium]|nr:class I SAM-dependent methyltransferase [Thermoanaerobaculia bacterium]